MLAGKAVVAIWHDIVPEARPDFYAWHLEEHIPERVAIPGFRRGRRYVAADAGTAPEFFVLYEADGPAVLEGPDYLARLNDPSPWTRRVMQGFRNNLRGVGRVAASHGPGVGGFASVLRFDAAPEAETAIAALVQAAATAPRLCGAHLCITSTAASEVMTVEKRSRTGTAEATPRWFALLEATDAEALAGLLPDAALQAAGATGPVVRGLYRLEHSRSALD